MKKYTFFIISVIIFIFLGIVTPCYPAGYLKLGGTMFSGTSDFLISGKQVNVNWFSKDIDLKTKLKLVLLKDGATFRVIATGLPLTNGYKNILDEWCNDTKWTPAVSDLGCIYKLKIATEDGLISATSMQFNVYPADHFAWRGQYTYIKLDTPKVGALLKIGQPYPIKWTCIPIPNRWPSRKLKLELFSNHVKVKDMAILDLNFNQCPISGSFSWTPESSLVPGNNYQIKISGDNNAWMSNMFIIAYSGGKPGDGSTFHKVGQGKAGSPLQ